MGKNRFEEQSDAALVMNWGLLKDKQQEIYERLEGYLPPDWREELDTDLERIYDIVELAEAIMIERKMFDEQWNLKQEFAKHLP